MCKLNISLNHVITCRNTSYCGLLCKKKKEVLSHKNIRKHGKKVENFINLCIAYYKRIASLFYRVSYVLSQDIRQKEVEFGVKTSCEETHSTNKATIKQARQFLE